MSDASPAGDASGIYVYGVVARGTSPTLFEGVGGIDAEEPVVLVDDGELAAVASVVSLAEFGVDVLPGRLRDPQWLEAKVRAHDAVLGAAVGRTAVVPFRFGTIYESEEHVRSMLGERRDLAAAVDRLRDTVELGVTGYLNRERLRARLAADRGLADQSTAASGRAYMERRSLERELDASLADTAASYAQEIHDRLAAVAADARANPVRPSDPALGREMFLNGAYLVRGDVAPLRDAVAAAREDYAEHGISLELTGPWPPYNFVEELE